MVKTLSEDRIKSLINLAKQKTVSEQYDSEIKNGTSEDEDEYDDEEKYFQYLEEHYQADDALSVGNDDGRIELAREILSELGIEY